MDVCGIYLTKPCLVYVNFCFDIINPFFCHKQLIITNLSSGQECLSSSNSEKKQSCFKGKRTTVLSQANSLEQVTAKEENQYQESPQRSETNKRINLRSSKHTVSNTLHTIG